MEEALTHLARAGGYTLVRCVVFEEPETMIKLQRQQAEEETTEQSVRRGEVSSWLAEAYGGDPTGPDFPWENLNLTDLAISAAPSLDMTPAEAREMFEQVRGEAMTRAALDALAAQAPPPPADPADMK
jgi:hypothetical protein